MSPPWLAGASCDRAWACGAGLSRPERNRLYNQSDTARDYGLARRGIRPNRQRRQQAMQVAASQSTNQQSSARARPVRGHTGAAQARCVSSSLMADFCGAPISGTGKRWKMASISWHSSHHKDVPRYMLCICSISLPPSRHGRDTKFHFSTFMSELLTQLAGNTESFLENSTIGTHAHAHPCMPAMKIGVEGVR